MPTENIQAVYRSTGVVGADKLSRRFTATVSGTTTEGRHVALILDPSAGSGSLLVGALTPLQSATRGVTVDLRAILAKMHPPAEALLRRGDLVEAITDILQRQAEFRGVRALGIEVSSFSDPDEARSELVISQRVDLSAADAFVYWDHVGAAVSSWAATLSQEDRSFVDRYVSLDIRWSDAQPATV